MATGLLGTEVIPINLLLNPQPVMNSFGYSNPRANIGNPNRILGNVIPGMLPLTAFGLLSQAGNFFNNEPMSAQDVINSHLSQSENNYKTWDFGYTNQMSEADARAKGYIIPPEPTVTDEERKRNLTLPNIPPVMEQGWVEEFPIEESKPTILADPVLTPDEQGWREEFPIEEPNWDSMILHTEGLLKDDKVTSGILDETAPPFYSKIKKTIEDAKMEKGNADQWIGYINNAGVNQEELDWIGLKDYLADKKSVTKEDVLNFVTMNDLAVQVKDIVLGAESDAIRFLGDTMEMIEGQGTTLTHDPNVPEILRNAAGYQDAKNILHNDDELYNQLQNYYSDYYIKKNNLKYPKDFEDLDENDFDILKKNFLKHNFGIVRGSSDQGKTMFNRPQLITEGDYTDYKEMVFQLPIEGSKFTQGHYTKYPNTFAHARFNTREIDGKKTLFIEELQSDWIHKGKKKGFITGKERTYDIVNKEIDDLVSQRTSGEMSKEEYLPKYIALLEELNDIARLETGVTSEKVPDIPFKKNWQDIVLKRLIRYASENGFDAIAMTGGNIQADRYDLSKYIDSVKISASDKAEGKIHLIAGNELDLHIYPDQLEEHIGKDLAKKIKNDLKEKNILENYKEAKILEQKGEFINWDKTIPKGVVMPTTEYLEYKGLDLKIGGEGLKSMYDKIFSKSLNKIGKKFDAKVELKNLDDDSDMWFMDLTPSMKKKAIEAGFPIAYNKPVSPLFQFA